MSNIILCQNGQRELTYVNEIVCYKFFFIPNSVNFHHAMQLHSHQAEHEPGFIPAVSLRSRFISRMLFASPVSHKNRKIFFITAALCPPVVEKSFYEVQHHKHQNIRTLTFFCRTCHLFAHFCFHGDTPSLTRSRLFNQNPSSFRLNVFYTRPMIRFIYTAGAKSSELTATHLSH